MIDLSLNGMRNEPKTDQELSINTKGTVMHLFRINLSGESFPFLFSSYKAVESILVEEAKTGHIRVSCPIRFPKIGIYKPKTHFDVSSDKVVQTGEFGGIHKESRLFGVTQNDLPGPTCRNECTLCSSPIRFISHATRKHRKLSHL